MFFQISYIYELLSQQRFLLFEFILRDRAVLVNFHQNFCFSRR